MKTLTQFVKENKIRIKIDYADSNKNVPDWKDANHYKITLKKGNKTLSTYFSQGYGITEEPTTEDVLNALASDSSGIENARSFEDWASEYGFDTNSRKAERIFHICEKQADKLKNFLGDVLYNELLFNTESL